MFRVFFVVFRVFVGFFRYQFIVCVFVLLVGYSILIRCKMASALATRENSEIARLFVRHRRPLSTIIDVNLGRQLELLFWFIVGHAGIVLGFGQQTLLLRKTGRAAFVRRG